MGYRGDPRQDPGPPGGDPKKARILIWAENEGYLSRFNCGACERDRRQKIKRGAPPEDWLINQLGCSPGTKARKTFRPPGLDREEPDINICPRRYTSDPLLFQGLRSWRWWKKGFLRPSDATSKTEALIDMIESEVCIYNDRKDRGKKR